MIKWAVLVLACVGMACGEKGGGRSGCVSSSECPAGSDCVTEGSERVCRPRPPPDAGEDPDLDASTPYYCSDVKAILDRSCISNCHGENPTTVIHPPFRLDSYVQPDGGDGAFAKAARIKLRVTDLETMPPRDNPMPTAEERRMVGRWVKRGALYCADAGS